MSVKASPAEVGRLLDRVEDLGYRSLRAFAPWLLFASVPAVVVRFVMDPTWLPAEVGVGGLFASGAGYMLRWRFPLPAGTSQQDWP